MKYGKTSQIKITLFGHLYKCVTKVISADSFQRQVSTLQQIIR